MNPEDLKNYLSLARAIIVLAEQQSAVSKLFLVRLSGLEQRASLRARLDNLPHDHEGVEEERNQLAAQERRLAEDNDELQKPVLDAIARGESMRDQLSALLEQLGSSQPPLPGT